MAYKEEKIKLHSLTTAIDRGGYSATRSDRFTPRKETWHPPASGWGSQTV